MEGLLEGGTLVYNWKLLIAIIILVVCTSLFILIPSRRDDSTNKELIELQSSKSALVINKALPLADEVSKDLIKKENTEDDYSVYSDFYIVAKSKGYYKLIIEKHSDKSTISDKYVKVLLLNGDNNKIIKKYNGASYLTLDKLEKYKGNYLLYEGKLSKNISKHFKLIMWTSDEYVVKNKTEYFNGKVDVYSYQEGL